MARAKLFTSVGDQFGSLKISGSIFREGGVRKVECRCACGMTTIAYVNHLFSGQRTSCGCKKIENSVRQGRKNRKHGGVTGGRRSPTYLSWTSMLLRCENPNATGYANYGARGISICDRWKGDDGFANFLADMGERPPGTTLDRYPDNDGNYEPSNCRWADTAEQKRNRRNSVLLTYRGQTKSASEWAREAGTHRNNILRRLKRGLPLDQVICR